MNNDFNQSNNTNSLGKYKNIRSRGECQDWRYADPQVNPEIIVNPFKYFSDWTIRQLRVLNCLFYWSATTGEIFIRQDTLARYAGYKSREHVNRLLGELIESGIIASYYRHKTSCLYKVSSFFNDHNVRTILRPLFNALKFFSIALLNQPIEQNITQYITNSLSNTYTYSTNTTISTVSTTCRLRRVLNASAREGEVELSSLKKEAKGVVMEDQVNGIPSYIEEITYPKMTYQQKMQLSQYSEPVVRSALIVLNNTKNVSSAVGFLLGTCRNKSLKNPTTTRKEKEPMPRVEPFYTTSTKEERDLGRKKKLIYMATVRGESELYLHSLLNNNSPIVDIENAEWERVKFLRNEEAKAAGKPLPFVLGTVAPVFTQSVTNHHDLKRNEPVTNNHGLEYTAPTDTGQTSFKESGQRSIRDILQEHFKGAL